MQTDDEEPGSGRIKTYAACCARSQQQDEEVCCKHGINQIIYVSGRLSTSACASPLY